MGTIRALSVLAALSGVALAGCTGPEAAPAGDRERTAKWSVTLPGKYGSITSAQAVDTHLVVLHTDRVTVLNRATGKQRWSMAANLRGALSEARVWATSRALVVLQAPEDHTGPGTATVYDIATGKRRAALEYGSKYGALTQGNVVVTEDALLTVRRKDGDDQSRFESVDLDTGKRLWKRDYGFRHEPFAMGGPSAMPSDYPVYRDPLRVPTATLMVLSRDRNANDPRRQVSVVDPGTGRTVGKPASTGPRSGALLLDNERYIVWDQVDGCVQKVTGYDAANPEPAWSREAATWENDPRPDCVEFQPRLVEGGLLTHTEGERPMLIDPADGEATWTGPKGFYPIGVAGDVVVGRHSRKDNTVAAYHVSDSRKLWGAAGRPRIDGAPEAVVPGYAVLSSSVNALWTYDTRTGEKRRCEGKNHLIAAGDGWLAAGPRSEADGSTSTLRYFAL